MECNRSDVLCAGVILWRYGERPDTGNAWNEALQLGYPAKMDSVGVSPIGRYFELQPGVESESVSDNGEPPSKSVS